MFSQKSKKNGQAALGGILMIVLLIALVVFIFFLIRRPEGPPTPPPVASVGIPSEFAEQFKAELTETAENYPLAQVLPYGGPPDNQPFAIYPPTKDGTILVEVDEGTDENEVKMQVRDWIQAQGYDLEGYNFVFKKRAFPK